MTVKNKCDQSCDLVYVSWRWAVGIIAGLIVVASTMAWAGGVQLEKISNQSVECIASIDELVVRVSRVEQYNSKIDTILIELRKKK